MENLTVIDSVPFMTRLTKNGKYQGEEDKSLILRSFIQCIRVGTMKTRLRLMLRFLVLLLSTPLILISQITQQSYAAENIFETPKVISFTVSQSTIEIAQSNAELNFNLKISHPIGISSSKTILWFTSRDKKIELSTDLIRQPL